MGLCGSGIQQGGKARQSDSGGNVLKDAVNKAVSNFDALSK